jgi:hypothetical protein
MPVVVRDASSAAATYLVSTAAARRLLPGPELEPLELLPGRALFSIAAIDYRDNDLGDYNEVSLAFFVRRRDEPRGVPWLGAAVALMRSRLATWIWKLPVDQGFTCAAGRGIWGFPKTIQKIDFEYRPERVTCKLDYDGAFALSLSVPRGGARSLPESDLTTYTFIEGVLHRTAFRSGADGFGVRVGGAELTLGSGPIAAELRALGLPRRSLLTTWMERMHARFESAEKI